MDPNITRYFNTISLSIDDLSSDMKKNLPELKFIVDNHILNISSSVEKLLEKFITIKINNYEMPREINIQYNNIILYYRDDIYNLSNLNVKSHQLNGYISRGCIIFYYNEKKILILRKSKQKNIPPIFNYITDTNTELSLLKNVKEFAEPIFIVDDININSVPIDIINKRITNIVDISTILNNSINGNFISRTTLHIDGTY